MSICNPVLMDLDANHVRQSPDCEVSRFETIWGFCHAHLECRPNTSTALTSHRMHAGLSPGLQWMQAPPEAQAMGDALLAAAEPRVRRAAAVGAHPLPGDWKVLPQGDLPSVVPLAGAHMLAPPGACPAMVLDGSQPAITVAPLDSSNLQVSCVPLYLGAC